MLTSKKGFLFSFAVFFITVQTTIFMLLVVTSLAYENERWCHKAEGV